MWSLHAPLRWAAVTLPSLAGIVFATALMFASSPACADAPPVKVGGPFELIAPDGKTVTDETYRGKWLLLFFGYTSCPDLCPTTLNEIARALEVLGTAAARVQPIFITVDPARDTPDVMGKYTAAFDSRIVGLTGSSQQIAAVSEEYGAYSAPQKTEPTAQMYAVDHSTYIYIIDPGGQFVRGLDFDAQGERIAETLRKLIAENPDRNFSQANSKVQTRSAR